jgi:predicted secreted protein
MIKISAKGMILKIATTATPTTSLLGLRTIGFNQGAREQIDVTTHDSTVTKEHVDSGLRDTPEIGLTLIYDPADTIHELVRAAHAAGTLVYFTIVLPDTGAAAWACSGHVTQFEIPNRGVGDPLEANITLKAKVAETFTA